MKRVLSALICVLLLIQIVPLVAFAQENPDSEVKTAYYDIFDVKRSVATRAPLFDKEKMKKVLREGVIACQEEIDISSFAIPAGRANVQAVAGVLYREVPESFHLEQAYGYWENNGIIVSIFPHYTYSLSEYQVMLAEMEASKAELVQGIKGNPNLDDVQKALLLHDRLSMICQYDYTFSHMGGTAYGAMVTGDAVCQGYTIAYAYLLEEVGIRSELCESNALNHIWNIVYIDNTPYHVDVTWDDTAWGSGERGVEGAVEHKNFLRSSDGIYDTQHTATDYITTPSSTKYDSYFWQDSDTAFQLIGDELYYIDNTSKKIERYSDQKELWNVDSYWGNDDYYWANQARLSGDGTYLYYSLADGIYQYDVSRNTATEIFAPELANGTGIYGFAYKDGYLVCDISSDAPWYSERTVLYQIKEGYGNTSVGTVEQWNIALDSDININFMLDVDDSIASTAQVKITVADETYVKKVTELETVDGLYQLCVEMAAAQMNDTISLQIINGSDGGKVLTYSVRQYCDTILSDSTQSAYHPLVKEMLHYGAMAQVLFDYNTAKLANEGITGTAANAVPASAETLQNEGKAGNCAFYGASLVYRDQIAVRFYFTGDAAGLTFAADGKTYTPVAKDGMYYIEIADILPQNLHRQITLTATDDSGNTLTATYGPMNYIVRMHKKGNTDVKNLLKALYNYHLAAKNLTEN